MIGNARNTLARPSSGEWRILSALLLIARTLCHGRSKTSRHNIYLYILVFICRLLIIFEKRKEKRTPKNNIEIIRDRRMGKKNCNVIIHLTFLNILNSF